MLKRSKSLVQILLSQYQSGTMSARHLKLLCLAAMERSSVWYDSSYKLFLESGGNQVHWYRRVKLLYLVKLLKGSKGFVA